MKIWLIVIVSVGLFLLVAAGLAALLEWPVWAVITILLLLNQSAERSR